MDSSAIREPISLMMDSSTTISGTVDCRVLSVRGISRL